jgi:hypothetical protein
VRGNRKNSKLWDDAMILGLTENMRVLKLIHKSPGDTEFHQELLEHAQWLLALGEGKLPAIAEVPITGESVIEIPQSMARDKKEDVIDEVFGDLRYHIGDKHYLKSRMLLAADNDIVNETNLELVKRLPGELHTFRSVDNAVDDEGGSLFPSEHKPCPGARCRFPWQRFSSIGKALYVRGHLTLVWTTLTMNP